MVIHTFKGAHDGEKKAVVVKLYLVTGTTRKNAGIHRIATESREKNALTFAGSFPVTPGSDLLSLRSKKGLEDAERDALSLRAARFIYPYSLS